MDHELPPIEPSPQMVEIPAEQLPTGSSDLTPITKTLEGVDE